MTAFANREFIVRAQKFADEIEDRERNQRRSLRPKDEAERKRIVEAVRDAAREADE